MKSLDMNFVVMLVQYHVETRPVKVKVIEVLNLFQ